MTSSVLISVSGPDGSGKSTQLAMLEGALERRGKRVAVLWHRPGYSEWLGAAKDLVRRKVPNAIPPPGESNERTAAFAKGHVRVGWLAMAISDTIVHYAVRLRAALRANDVVLCDRWIDDAVMDLALRYTGLEGQLRAVSELVWRIAPTPVLSVLLDLPYEVALARSVAKNEPFADTETVRRARSERYRELGARAERYAVVDATRPAPEVACEILRLLDGSAKGRA